MPKNFYRNIILLNLVLIPIIGGLLFSIWLTQNFTPSNSILNTDVSSSVSGLDINSSSANKSRSVDTVNLNNSSLNSSFAFDDTLGNTNNPFIINLRSDNVDINLENNPKPWIFERVGVLNNVLDANGNRVYQPLDGGTQSKGYPENLYASDYLISFMPQYDETNNRIYYAYNSGQVDVLNLETAELDRLEFDFEITDFRVYNGKVYFARRIAENDTICIRKNSQEEVDTANDGNYASQFFYYYTKEDDRKCMLEIYEITDLENLQYKLIFKNFIASQFNMQYPEIAYIKNQDVYFRGGFGDVCYYSNDTYKYTNSQFVQGVSYTYNCGDVGASTYTLPYWESEQFLEELVYENETNPEGAIVAYNPYKEYADLYTEELYSFKASDEGLDCNTFGQDDLDEETEEECEAKARKGREIANSILPEYTVYTQGLLRNKTEAEKNEDKRSFSCGKYSIKEEVIDISNGTFSQFSLLFNGQNLTYQKPVINPNAPNDEYTVDVLNSSELICIK